MSIAFRSVATVSALVISATTPALAQPSAAFPPEPPPASAEPRAALPAQTSSPYPQSRPVYAPQRPLYYPPPAPSLSLVRFTSDTPNTRFDIELDRNGEVGSCNDACAVYLEPGRYSVRVASPAQLAETSRPFEIHGPARVFVSPRSEAGALTWLGVAVVGMTAVCVGGFEALVYAANHDDQYQDPTPPAWMGAVVLVGVVMTPLGWVMFGQTYKPRVKVAPPGW